MRIATVSHGLAAMLALALAFANVGMAASETADDLLVHEWGTFLAMSGSDGVALEGMYHEEHALPGFVHARGRDQLRLPSVLLKGETPVIYFYTDQPRRVCVHVDFPRGVWTQWYPQALLSAPALAQVPSPAAPRNGKLIWQAELLPIKAGGAAPTLPMSARDALWNFAREVDAAYVKTADYTVMPARDEYERFLFYRGLGEATLPLRFSEDAGGTLELDRNSPHGVGHLFVIRVEGGRGNYAYYPTLAPGGRLSGVIPGPSEARPLPAFSEALGDDLCRRLEESGLFAKEARAMVNTWRASYFESEGVRVLFVLPQAWTDGFIPLKVAPSPKQTVRVMVGRIELLTAARERLAEEAIRRLDAPDAATREQAFAFLREQGRYVEPIIRRVLRTTRDERLRTLCRRLLSADFVTELRAAIHDATDGRRLQEDPVHVRAQLAGLLREIGQDEEARAEGRAVLDALRGRPAPPPDQHEARHYFRAGARAAEAVGDDREAARWLGQFIRFGSQVAARQECRSCHQVAGDNVSPTGMAWFKDWWAGTRYASHVSRLGPGEAERTIAAQQAALAKAPGDVAARMMLAYLYAARGERSKAQALWAGLERPATPDGRAKPTLAADRTRPAASASR
jgi:hypothetical protein